MWDGVRTVPKRKVIKAGKCPMSDIRTQMTDTGYQILYICHLPSDNKTSRIMFCRGDLWSPVGEDSDEQNSRIQRTECGFYTSEICHL